MKKYKFEFDYALSDCVMIVLHCVVVSFVIVFICSFIGGLFMSTIGYLGGEFAFLGYFISVIYTLIYIIRYVLEGTTIIEVKSEE